MSRLSSSHLRKFNKRIHALFFSCIFVELGFMSIVRGADNWLFLGAVVGTSDPRPTAKGCQKYKRHDALNYAEHAKRLP